MTECTIETEQRLHSEKFCLETIYGSIPLQHALELFMKPFF